MFSPVRRDSKGPRWGWTMLKVVHIIKKKKNVVPVAKELMNSNFLKKGKVRYNQDTKQKKQEFEEESSPMTGDTVKSLMNGRNGI